MAISAVTIRNRTVSGNRRRVLVDFTMGASTETINNTNIAGLGLSSVDGVSVLATTGSASFGFAPATGVLTASTGTPAVRAEIIGR